MIGGMKQGASVWLAAFGLLEAFSNPKKVAAAMKEVKEHDDRLEQKRKALDDRERFVRKAEADLEAARTQVEDARGKHASEVGAFTKAKNKHQQDVQDRERDLDKTGFDLKAYEDALQSRTDRLDQRDTEAAKAMREAEKLAAKAQTAVAKANQVREDYEQRINKLQKLQDAVAAA